MFQLIAEAMAAWNQVGLLIGAGIFAGLGLLLLGNRIYWRFNARREVGTIVGVREIGARSYYPVYHYVSQTGETIEATSDVGTNSTRGMDTGRQVELMVLENDPRKASAAGSYGLEVISSIFSAAGIGLGYFALTAWPITRITFIVLAGMIGFIAYRLSTKWRSAKQRPTIAEWKAQRRRSLEEAPIRPAEDIAAPMLTSSGKRISPKLAPVFMVLGVGILGLGLYLGNKLYKLQASGQRAPGTVVSLARSSGSGSNHSYHAIIRFRIGDKAEMEFRDGFGSDPPSLHVGDAVTVLYLPDSPKQSAMVDRHQWNWAPPVGLILLGAVFAYAGIRAQSVTRSAAAT